MMALSFVVVALGTNLTTVTIGWFFARPGPTPPWRRSSRRWPTRSRKFNRAKLAVAFGIA